MSYEGSRARIDVARTILGMAGKELNGQIVTHDTVTAVAQVHATLAIAEAIRELAVVLEEKPI